MSTGLFVGNLSFDTNELELRDVFGPCGRTLEVNQAESSPPRSSPAASARRW